MKSRLIFALFFIALCGCKKDNVLSNQQEFDGVVIDYSTHVAIPNATVQMVKADGISRTRSSILFTNAAYFYTVTDANGKFRFVEPIDSKQIYKITASKQNYAFMDDNVIASSLKSSANQFNDVLYIDQLSFLKIIFHDTNSSSLNDSLSVTTTYMYVEPSSNPPVGGQPFIAESHYYSEIMSYNNIVPVGDSIPGTDFTSGEISWYVYNNGVLATGDTTVTLNQYGTLTINLFY